MIVVFCPQKKIKEIVPMKSMNRLLNQQCSLFLIVPILHLESVSQSVVKTRIIVRNCFYRVVSLFVSLSPFDLLLMDITVLLTLLPTQRPGHVITRAMLALYSTGFITELKGSRVMEKTGYHSAALITSP